MTILRALRADAAGRIVLANIHCAHRAGHLPADVTGDFLRRCASDCAGAPMNAETVITSMLNLAHRDSDKYRFKRVPAPRAVDSLSVVVDADRLLANDDLALLRRDRVFASGVRRRLAARRDRLAILLKALKNPNMLADDPRLGKRWGIFFATAPAATAAQRRTAAGTAGAHADRLRDFLGLAHISMHVALIEIILPREAVEAALAAGVPVAAPTFIEAGRHTRFRARTDAPCPRHWGRTADLARCAAPGAAEVDGAPEIVLGPVPYSPLFDCVAVGVTGCDPAPIDDGGFAEMIAGGVDWDDMVAELEALMAVPA